MQPKINKQYIARLNLPNYVTAELIGEDLGVLKEVVQTYFKGGCRFEPNGTADPGLLIYHPTVWKGETPLGWIASFEVPTHMSVRATFDLQREKIAA